MDIFKRAWKLTIEVGGKLKTYQEINGTDESLKIDFDITNCIGGTFAEGNITITNLTFEDMSYLATSVSPVNGRFKRNKILLEAGYVGNIASLIGGNIIECDAEFNNVDASISLKVQGGVANNLLNNNIRSSFSGNIDFKTAIEDCAKNNDLKLRYDSKIPPRQLTDYSFNGTPFQQIGSLRKYYPDTDIFIAEDGETLNVLLKEGGEQINTTELSRDTGLIGKPKPTTIGVNVRSVLNTNFKAGGFCRLKNENLKAFDGVYRIQEIHHRGSNKGDIWETELTLQRTGNG